MDLETAESSSAQATEVADKQPAMRERKTIEVEKFKRRIIRAVARHINEGKNEEEMEKMWETMKKESRYDCKLLWERMRALILKKLIRMLPAGDRMDSIPSIARLNATEWLLFDLVLVHEKIDVIGEDLWENTGEEPEGLYELFFLVQEYEVEQLTGTKLIDAWLSLTREYNDGERKCSPMMLQRRWYQMKQASKERFYKFWGNYRGNANLLDKARKFKPTNLQVDIVRKYRNIITSKFPDWTELIAAKKVVLAHEFDERITATNKANQGTQDNLPEVELVEQNVEIITLEGDSDSEQSNENEGSSQKLKLSKGDNAKSSNNKLPIKIKTESEPIDVDEMDSLKLLESINIPCETPFGQIEGDSSGMNIDSSLLDGNAVSPEDILENETINDVTMSPCDESEDIENVEDDDIDEYVEEVTEDNYDEDLETANSSIVIETSLSNPSPVQESFEAGPVDKNNLLIQQGSIVTDDLRENAEKTLSDDDNLKKTTITSISTPSSPTPENVTDLKVSSIATPTSPTPENVTDLKVSSIATPTSPTPENVTDPKVSSIATPTSPTPENVSDSNVSSISTPISGRPEAIDHNETRVSTRTSPRPEVVINHILAQKANDLTYNPDTSSATKRTYLSNDSDIISAWSSKVLDEIDSDKYLLGNFEELPSDIQFVDDGIVIHDEEEDIKVTNVKIEIKEEIEDTNDEMETNETTLETGKVDLKLLLFPTVYTKKLDHMDVFQFLEYDQIRDKRIIECASIESKPIDVKAVKMEEMFPLKEEPNDQHTDVDLNNLSGDDDLFLDALHKHRINSKSWFFKKPQVKDYNPVQLCKNPDFNTRLKRLTAGFLSYERNREYLKRCQPITIDLHKAFEMKLIDNTVYLKEDVVNNESISKLSNQISMAPMLPVRKPGPLQINRYMNNIDISSKLPMCVQTSISTTILQSVSERNKVVPEKEINLPDINEVRRINQKLLCAEVAPIQTTSQCPPVKVIPDNVSDISGNVKDKYYNLIDDLGKKDDIQNVVIGVTGSSSNNNILQVTDGNPNIHTVNVTESSPSSGVVKVTGETSIIDVDTITDSAPNIDVLKVTDGIPYNDVVNVTDGTPLIDAVNETDSATNIMNDEPSSTTGDLNSMKEKLMNRLSSISKACPELSNKGYRNKKSIEKPASKGPRHPSVPWTSKYYKYVVKEDFLLASDTVDKMLMIFTGEKWLPKKKSNLNHRQSSVPPSIVEKEKPEDTCTCTDLMPSDTADEKLSNIGCVSKKEKKIKRQRQKPKTDKNKIQKRLTTVNVNDFCCWARKKITQKGVNNDIHLCKSQCMCCCRLVLGRILKKRASRKKMIFDPIILSDEDGSMLPGEVSNEDESISSTPATSSSVSTATMVPSPSNVGIIDNSNSITNTPSLSEQVSNFTQKTVSETPSSTHEPSSSSDTIDRLMWKEQDRQIDMQATVTSNASSFQNPSTNNAHDIQVPPRVTIRRSARTKIQQSDNNMTRNNYQEISKIIQSYQKPKADNIKHVKLKHVETQSKTSPIFIGKNKILLSTKPSPPGLPLDDTTQLLLPNGIHFVLLPNGELALSVDSGVEINQNQVMELQSIIQNVQKYLDTSLLVNNMTSNINESSTLNNASVLDVESEKTENSTSLAAENLALINDTQHSVTGLSADTNPDQEMNDTRMNDFQLNKKGDHTEVETKIDANNTEKNKSPSDKDEHVRSSHELMNNEVESLESVLEKQQIEEPSASDVLNIGRKTILSDLMEMSGISEEDAKIPEMPTPNLIMTINPLPLSLDEIQQSHLSTPESTQEVDPSDYIKSASALTALACRPDLKIVTAYSELKSSFEKNCTFYKLDVITGEIVPVNVAIKKRDQVYESTEKPQAVVDLTDDNENEPKPPNTDTSQGTENDKTENDESLSIATPVRLFRAIHPSILRNNSKGLSLLKTFQSGIRSGDSLVRRVDARKIFKIVNINKRKQNLNDNRIEVLDSDEDGPEDINTTQEQTTTEKTVPNSNEDSCDSDDEPLAKKAKRQSDVAAYNVNRMDNVESNEKSSNEEMTLLEMPDDMLMDQDIDPQPELEPSENDSEEDCILGV